MYHIVDDAVDDPIAVSVSCFESHMRALREYGYSVLTVDRAIRIVQGAEQAPRHAVLITFDDGYADSILVALPILLRYDLSATLFVPTAYVGGTNRWNLKACYDIRHADWDELRIWTAAGLNIGGHAHDHTCMKRLSRDELHHTVDTNKELLESRLGITVRAFAYPFGHFTTQARSVVQSRYDIAFSVDDGTWAPRRDGFAINRMGVWPQCTVAELVEGIDRVLRMAAE